jgi:hypothetical protein
VPHVQHAHLADAPSRTAVVGGPDAKRVPKQQRGFSFALNFANVDWPSPCSSSGGGAVVGYPSWPGAGHKRDAVAREKTVSLKCVSKSIRAKTQIHFLCPSQIHRTGGAWSVGGEARLPCRYLLLLRRGWPCFRKTDGRQGHLLCAGLLARPSGQPRAPARSLRA